MKSQRHNLNIATALVASYLVIALIPITVAFTVYFRYDKVLSERTQLTNEYVTETIAKRIETIMIDVRNLYKNITSNKNFYTVSRITDSNYYFNFKEYFSFLNDFNSYKTNENILFYYIYFENTDYVFSKHGIYESEFFYKTFIRDTTFEEWKNKLKWGNKGIHFSQSICIDGEKHTAALFNFSDPSQKNVTIAILVDTNSFFQKTNKNDFESLCNLYLFDNYGKLVLYNANQQSDTLPNNIKEIQTKKNIVITTPITFETVNMTLVAVAPSSEALAHIGFMRGLSSLLFIFCIVFAGILSLCFTIKHYKPIKTTLRMLGIYDRKAKHSQIHQAISRINSEIDKQNKSLRHSVLSRIIKRSYIREQVNDLLRKYGINFNHENFMLVGFYVENIDAILKTESDLSAFKYDDLSFVITNLFEELLNTEDSTAYVLDIDNILFCIMNISASVQNVDTFISEKYTYGLSTLNSHFGLNLSYVLSDIHHSLSELPDAYSEALQTLEYKSMLNISNSLSYSEISKEMKIQYEFTLEKEQNLINCLRVSDFEGAVEIVDDVLKKAKENKNISPDHLKCLILDIATAILKIPNTSPYLEFDPFKILKISNNINLMRENIISAIKEICKNYAPNSNLQQFQDNIICYIQTNYNSPLLNIDSIGYYFNMTPDYLSKMFREINGESLVDYINKYRLSKAKELIISKKHTITDISAMVGYNHVRTFNRVFKKYEGITPTMFKNQLK